MYSRLDKDRRSESGNDVTAGPPENATPHALLRLLLPPAQLFQPCANLLGEGPQQLDVGVLESALLCQPH